MLDLLLIEWVTKMKPGSNSVEDHPQLSHNRHPVDGALVSGWCTGGCWFTVAVQNKDHPVLVWTRLRLVLTITLTGWS
jgi:hypothetical protein